MSTLPRICRQCQLPIPSYRGSRPTYCSDACKRKASAARLGNRPSYDVSPGTQGAITELIVSVDLMKRGFDVYRATSPACPCDLVAIKNGTMTRVEVKTAVRGLDGRIRDAYLNERQRASADVVAHVAHDGEIAYRPEMPDGL